MYNYISKVISIKLLKNKLFSVLNFGQKSTDGRGGKDFIERENKPPWGGQ